MNRRITSAPTNWGIDYSQNRVGDIYGSAMANTGNMLGNAIMQYAKDKKEREEKKAKEEAAARFILQSGAGKDMGITDEKSAMQAVKGVGVDNIQNFIQLQQRQKQIEQQDQQMKAEAEKLAQQNMFLQQKAAKVEQDAANNQRFMGQISGMAPNRNPAARTPQDVFAAAARTGVDPELAAGIARSMPEPTKAESKIEFTTAPDGTVLARLGNTMVPLRDAVEKKLQDGETRNFTRDGKTVTAFKDGTKWREVSSGQEIDITEQDILGARSTKPNPAVWGSGGGAPSDFKADGKIGNFYFRVNPSGTSTTR
jgi:hypothetical protein